MLSTRRISALRRELPASQHIPVSAHVSEHVIKTVAGDYLQVLRLEGASFECADEAELNAWHERLNILWRNIGSPQVALWTHVVRAPARLGGPGSRDGGFADELHRKYHVHLSDQGLMVNELYLSILYRPSGGLAPGLGSALSRAQRDGGRAELLDALDACEKLRSTLVVSLARYEPQVLGLYEAGGLLCSAPLEFLGVLVNGEWQRMPLPRASLREVLVSTRLLFGMEAMEYRMAGATRVGAFLGIKEYPTPSRVGMFNRLLSAPFAFILTQSFTFLSKGAAQILLQRQHHRLLNAGDFALSQAGELQEALDALTSNEFVMGDHHLSLQVLADLPETGDPGVGRLRTLHEQLAQARALLADTGMSVAREDLALEAAFWAQLPGCFAMRPRKAPITSRNFSAMVPFHNHPCGRATGNHWGEALAVLATSAGSPYHFSLHASDPHDDTGLKDTGHTFLCGPTGSGKTVLIGFLAALLSRQGATQIFFDKDCGLEILVRALGGVYLPLVHGRPTGLNPLQLPCAPGAAQTGAHLELLRTWLRALVCPRGSRSLSVKEGTELEQALTGTLALPPEARRLSRLLEFLDPTDPEGLYARLAPWCEVSRGGYAWVFDHPEDRVIGQLHTHTTLGFDVTDFLASEAVRTPVTLYLFHLVRQLLDGRRLVCWLDEFWRLLADPAFESFAKDGPKTWRKLNAVMCLATQSVSDVLNSPLSRTIIEQAPTKIFFPNSEADEREHCEGVGLTVRELALIRQLEPGSRAFLLRQGSHSVVCQLDLKALAGELAVISSRAGTRARLAQLLELHGPDPAAWLPAFLAHPLPPESSP